jgi:hypothetical protein
MQDSSASSCSKGATSKNFIAEKGQKVTLGVDNKCVLVNVLDSLDRLPCDFAFVR